MNDDALPAPLVPPEVDLRDFGFMPLDVQRLRDSDLAAEETPAACWAALLLWCAGWHQVPAGSIPDSDRWQAKHAGYLAHGEIAPAWDTVRAGALRGWVRCSDGRLYHPVIAEKAVESWKAKLAQRERTRAATEAREAKRRAALAERDVQRDVERDVHQGTGTVKGQGQGDPVMDSAPAAAGRRATRKCPTDFDVTPELVQWAAENAQGVDLERETAKLRDHTFKTARSDWPATWRNWIRTAAEDLARRPQRAQDRTDRGLESAALMTGGARATTPARPVQGVIDADTGRLIA